VKDGSKILLKMVWILIIKIGEGFLCFVEDGSTPSPAGTVQLQGHCRIPPRSTYSPAARQAPETDTDRGFRVVFKDFWLRMLPQENVSRDGTHRFFQQQKIPTKPE
jgi:hypothetical protein